VLTNALVLIGMRALSRPAVGLRRSMGSHTDRTGRRDHGRSNSVLAHALARSSTSIVTRWSRSEAAACARRDPDASRPESLILGARSRNAWTERVRRSDIGRRPAAVTAAPTWPRQLGHAQHANLAMHNFRSRQLESSPPFVGVGDFTNILGWRISPPLSSSSAKIATFAGSIADEYSPWDHASSS